MPGMVDPSRERQSYFADNLRPQMQGLGRVLPFFVWQWRPEFFPLRSRQPGTYARSANAHARSQKLNTPSRALSSTLHRDGKVRLTELASSDHAPTESIIACLLERRKRRRKKVGNRVTTAGTNGIRVLSCSGLFTDALRNFDFATVTVSS